MGAMPSRTLRPAVELTLAPGDWLGCCRTASTNMPMPEGAGFGRERVEALVREHAQGSAAALSRS